MRNHKLLMRLLCAFLSVLMLVCMAPAVMATTVQELAEQVQGTPEDEETNGPGTTAGIKDPSTYDYGSAMDRLDYMTKYYDNGEYSLYCDPNTAIVAYRKNATNEIMFTTPWDMTKEVSQVASIRNEMMSQILLTYTDSQNKVKPLNSYEHAVLKGQYSVSPIRNGVRVEYAMGDITARILVPMVIEYTAFYEKIWFPMQDYLTRPEATSEEARVWSRFQAFYQEKLYATETNSAKKEAIAKAYPVCEKKNIDLMVYSSGTPSIKELRMVEGWILKYCPTYNFEEMDTDYELVEYEEDATSPPVFRVALEYTIDENGLSVNLPANGLRYDESAYRITELKVLPFMGASYKGNPNTDAPKESYEGYSFIPDGSGALYDLTTAVGSGYRVYGEDYALFGKISGLHNEVMRMPVFGQALTHTAVNGKVTKSGFLAIIEEGASLATISLLHGTRFFSTVVPSFITRPGDTSKSGTWDVYASRRYTDDYKIRYIILSDDTKAAEAGLNNYYECSWMGMAYAYRDYLDQSSEGFNRLTSTDVKDSIPLYIETFGCVDTVKKVMSIPVTTSVALTSFKDIEDMYSYLAGEKITNVNFKMTGYANGGMYSDVPYKLKWEKSVGGKSGFKELLETAKREGFGLYPDFDFVYSTRSDAGSHVNMKKHAARTIENRYTTKRVYSVTQQTLISYFQMVMSPATYSHFYEKLEKRYSKYDASGISLSSFGNAINSDYDETEGKTTLREEALNLTAKALAYFKDKDYDIMVDGGNAFTWAYADHILDVPLDSSRYAAEMRTVPFMGVVLHGYVQFTGTAFNLEGNLRYAMLKAMENGASIYFVLSYANTELLKEDILLSQNYSVRYDIWKSRLVEIYQELNSVLADVQDKLIIGHKDLDATRVPDSDELLQDIIDEAKEQAALIAAKIQREKSAVSTIAQVYNKMLSHDANFDTLYGALLSQRYEGSELLTIWDTAIAEFAAGEGAISTATKLALNAAFSASVLEPVAKIDQMQADMATLVAAAKVEYNYLINSGADAVILASARAQLMVITRLYVDHIVKYYGSDMQFNITDDLISTFVDDVVYVSANDIQALMMRDYVNVNFTIPEDKIEGFIRGTEFYDGLSVADILGAYRSYLGMTVNKDGKKNIDYDTLLSIVNSTLRVPVDQPGITVGTGAVIGSGSSAASKYTTDNAVVMVTYGIDNKTAYKSILLNFNDYSVQTVVNGVTYTIEGYGYVVIANGN